MKKLKGHKLDFEKEIDQEDIDKLLQIASDNVKKGLLDICKNEYSYKFIIALLYAMLTDNYIDPLDQYAKEILTQKEKDLIIELYKKYELK